MNPISRIREHTAAQPFEPFELSLISGQRVSVGNLDLIAIHPGGKFVVVLDAERERRIYPLHIVSVDLVEQQTY